MHDLPLISTIAAAFSAAWILGLATQALRLSPIVGYLLAGILIGPYTPGFVGDLRIAHQLAEIGVILLMFGVGLHFHLKDLLAVKDVAIPGAVGQSLVATVSAIAVFAAFGIPASSGAVIGMAIAVASTVVLMRVLMDADVLSSPQGHVAVGWLIVEDIFTIALLVLIPVVGEGGSALWMTLGVALLKLAALVVILFYAGSRLVPLVLVRVAQLRSRELFTLTVLVSSIAVAAGSYFFFGASMALGAFLGGMVVAQSPVSHQAAADALPMRDAFAVLFFVSVGMVFDPSFLLEEPLMVVGALGIILIVKPVAALLIVAALGHSTRTALTVALGLAQIGEFSFILSELARRYDLMPEQGHSVLVAAAIVSISLNPLLFRSLPTIESWLRDRPLLWRLLNRRAESRLADTNAATVDAVAHSVEPWAIVVGYGPVGRSVHRILREADLSTVVVDLNMDTVSSLIRQGQRAIFGDAARESLLEQAGVRRASHLILTLPHSSERSAVVAAARNLNPDVRILVRARYLRERADLEQAGATAAVFEEAEAAVALARLVLSDTGVFREAADQRINDLRLELIRENVANIRSHHVRSIMVPWSRVRWLLASGDRESVLAQVAEERFSRWPVVESPNGPVRGYLLTKDLIVYAADADWLPLVRPISAVAPDDSVEGVLAAMQGSNTTISLVAQEGRPVGLITIEDILEQVVGQIEDEYPHAPPVSLARALANGAILLLDLRAESREQAVAQLVAEIPGRTLPSGTDRKGVVDAVLQREEEVSTNLGNGIAVPHTRVDGLASPIVVFGRCGDGVIFSPTDPPVHLLLLLLTPTEHPEMQITLLGQIATSCSEGSVREALMRARSPADVLALLAPRGRSF